MGSRPWDLVLLPCLYRVLVRTEHTTPCRRPVAGMAPLGVSHGRSGDALSPLSQRQIAFRQGLSAANCGSEKWDGGRSLRPRRSSVVGCAGRARQWRGQGASSAITPVLRGALARTISSLREEPQSPWGWADEEGRRILEEIRIRAWRLLHVRRRRRLRSSLNNRVLAALLHNISCSDALAAAPGARAARRCLALTGYSYVCALKRKGLFVRRGRLCFAHSIMRALSTYLHTCAEYIIHASQPGLWTDTAARPPATADRWPRASHRLPISAR